MSCGDNSEANAASSEDTETPDAGQRVSAGPNLSALVGELALLVHVAAVGGDHDADRISTFATTLQRETARECGRPSAPAAASTVVLPASAVRTTAIAYFTPATTAASIATWYAAASATVASSPTFHATLAGSDRTSWPPESIHVPPTPAPGLDELRRALHT
eukprot:1732646-Pleurochrysis_carterae.AAC.1